MNAFLEFLRRLQEGLKKTTLSQRLILGGVLAVVLVALGLTLRTASDEPVSYLFKRALSPEDLGVITAELDRMNYWYDTKDDKYVLVKDESVGRLIRTKLAQENKLPSGIKGWEIFDMRQWTTTEFDRNVNLHRAIEGEMRRHLESLEWVESVSVRISMLISNQSIYKERERDIGAAVSITPAEGFHAYLKDKKVVKGIENIIAKTIDGISKDNITINDPKGIQINDFVDDGHEAHIKQALEQERITKKQRDEIERKVQEHLDGILPRDRYKVSVSLELNFDRKNYKQRDVLPVVIKQRTPGLPYDDSVVRDSVKVSRQKVEENFKGQGFIPEGPPGQEPNIPPGYKENIDKWNTYNKNEDVENFLNGEKQTEHYSDAYDINRKSVAVSVDGTWEKKVDEKGRFIFSNGQFQRNYLPYPEDDRQKLVTVVQAAINYNSKRGDTVVVRNVPFDRSAQFAKEDSAYLRNKNIRRVVLYSLLALIVVFVVGVVYRVALHEIAERRRQKEREAARLRQLQREEALRALEMQSVESEYVQSEEERLRMELQEKAEQIAAERPGDVAKVVRSWLIEE